MLALFMKMINLYMRNSFRASHNNCISVCCFSSGVMTYKIGLLFSTVYSATNV